jgi:hypothetical protein
VIVTRNNTIDTVTNVTASVGSTSKSCARIKLGEAERAGNADDQAEDRGPHALPKHEAGNLRGARAEREPDTEFPRPLTRPVADHPVDTCRGEQQPKQGEAAHEQQRERVGRRINETFR